MNLKYFIHSWLSSSLGSEGKGQQAQGVVVFWPPVSPLLSRKASCWGSRPRKFLSISEASCEPPGLRMNLR